MTYLLSIDQGTTSTRSVLYDDQAHMLDVSQIELPNLFPQEGWVEHDPEIIYQQVIDTTKTLLNNHDIDASAIMAIGITNQRETTVLWNKETGEVLYNAIVWQDRRTEDYCKQLKSMGHESTILHKTGLKCDPYFSASKIRWILNHIPKAHELAKEGKLAFGTIDSFLLWRLTGGQVHATDITNASRTMLFNIQTCEWDPELLNIFEIPDSILPEVKACDSHFGETEPSIFGASIPICGMAGDQHAATIGQACFERGMLKSTYGTGCFMLFNTGTTLARSESLLTTIAYQIGNQVTYAIEGSIFIAGAAIQWLRDQMHLVEHAKNTEAIALAHDKVSSVIVVPAFTGLGAPYWDPKARGAILGLTRDSDADDVVVATLEAMSHQSLDLIRTMTLGSQLDVHELRVDGGMVHNSWLCQDLANMLDVSIIRPKNIETTAQGACFLAGLGCGHFTSLDQITQHWKQDQRFEPNMDPQVRKARYKRWKKAVKCVRSF